MKDRTVATWRFHVAGDASVVLLLAFTGFRVSSIVTLGRDAFQVGPDGHPYLRYWNIKSKREAAGADGRCLGRHSHRWARS